MGCARNRTAINMKDRFDGWIRLAVIIGGMYYAHTNTSSRIDSGKDETRLHWQSLRFTHSHFRRLSITDVE